MLQRGKSLLASAGSCGTGGAKQLIFDPPPLSVSEPERVREVRQAQGIQGE
jgi:hypothetical protein